MYGFVGALVVIAIVLPMSAYFIQQSNSSTAFESSEKRKRIGFTEKYNKINKMQKRSDAIVFVPIMCRHRVFCVLLLLLLSIARFTKFLFGFESVFFRYSYGICDGDKSGSKNARTLIK